VTAAWVPLLLLAVAGCTHPAGDPDLACAPRTMPTVRLIRLPEVVVHRNLDLVKDTNRGRGAVLRTLFESFGCTGTSLVEIPTSPFRQPSLSCTLRGELADLIVVGAHFGTVSAKSRRVDNWSGASLLPALRLSLSEHPRRHSFEFVAFSSEEDDPLGARSFVASLGAVRTRKIRAMVNIDGLGTGPLQAEVGRSDPRLLCDFWATSALIDLPLRANRSAPRTNGESEPFRRAGIPVIDLSSPAGRGASSGRSRPEAPEAIDEKTYHDNYRLLAVYLAMLDETLETGHAEMAGPNAVR